MQITRQRLLPGLLASLVSWAAIAGQPGTVAESTITKSTVTKSTATERTVTESSLAQSRLAQSRLAQRNPARQVFSFDQGAIEFSSQMASGRLNHIEPLVETLVQNNVEKILGKTAKKTFLVTIEPENTPVNNSPWYAFNVVADKKRELMICFQYRHGDHRYYPKVSHDGKHWEHAPANTVTTSADGQTCLTVQAGPQKRWVAAQPLNYTEQALRDWVAEQERKPFAVRRVIGQSVQGRPLDLLQLGNAQAACSIALLGRQHPPEVTGTIAQLAFVERLADDSDLSRRFRRHFKILVFPLINPDGVVHGHWRHNMNGVDLNRDWYTVQQPEIKAVINVLREQARSGDQPLQFALDFHSTRKDIFYSVHRHLVNEDYRIVDQWVARIRQQFPEFPVTDRPGSLEKGVSKNWFYKALGVPALTYEVGDETPRKTITAVADYAAIAMMELLLDRPGACQH